MLTLAESRAPLWLDLLCKTIRLIAFLWWHLVFQQHTMDRLHQIAVVIEAVVEMIQI